MGDTPEKEQTEQQPPEQTAGNTLQMQESEQTAGNTLQMQESGEKNSHMSFKGNPGEVGFQHRVDIVKSVLANPPDKFLS